MSYRDDYIPRSDIALVNFATNLMSHISKQENQQRWCIMAPTEHLLALAEDFKAKVTVCKSNDCTRRDVVSKNDTKVKLVKGIREFVQGFLARNANVNAEDKTLLWLPVHDTTPSSVPPPLATVSGILTFPARGLVEICRISADGEMRNKKSRCGVRIYYGIMGESTVRNRFRLTRRPETGDDLPHSVFTRQKQYRFDFVGESGNEVFFCMRFENPKGQTGPWGTLISTFIP